MALSENEICELKCAPLCTIDELVNWKSTTCRTPFQPASLTCLTADNSSKKIIRKDFKNTPKTLVCHDMKGGYLEDSYIDGCSNWQAFNFTQWDLIDTFVYFSHHFVTIPPPCWIHAGHLHGVPVLGTFITEWEAGSKICRTLFESLASVDKLVEKLASITHHYNFDGWLINIENPVSSQQVDNIEYFLVRLKAELVLQCPLAPNRVIWYDSITTSGELKWQNQLNDKNKRFFDACDAIFLNYAWTSACLAKSAEAAGQQRLLDVYVGIDVFGRNCFGGGGFNTIAALDVVRGHGLSAAIFAPGWVYERHTVDEFPTLNAKFWRLLVPQLNVRGVSQLPIATTFCPGYGRTRHRRGRLLHHGPWFNLGHQQRQSCLAAVDGLVDADFHYGSEFFSPRVAFGRQSVCVDDAYDGGGCLLIHSAAEQSIYPLFVCDVALTGSVMVALAFKEVTVDAQLSVVLATDSGNHRISLASAHGLIPRTQYSNYHHHCLSSAETSAADAWATRSVFGFISFVSGLSSTLPSGPT